MLQSTLACQYDAEAQSGCRPVSDSLTISRGLTCMRVQSLTSSCNVLCSDECSFSSNETSIEGPLQFILILGTGTARNVRRKPLFQLQAWADLDMIWAGFGTPIYLLRGPIYQILHLTVAQISS